MQSSKITVFASTTDRGKLTLYVGGGDLTTTIKLLPEQAIALADDIRAEVDRMPRHRIGTAADLGCEVL